MTLVVDVVSKYGGLSLWTFLLLWYFSLRRKYSSTKSKKKRTWRAEKRRKV